MCVQLNYWVHARHAMCTAVLPAALLLACAATLLLHLHQLPTPLPLLEYTQPRLAAIAVPMPYPIPQALTHRQGVCLFAGPTMVQACQRMAASCSSTGETTSRATSTRLIHLPQVCSETGTQLQ